MRVLIDMEIPVYNYYNNNIKKSKKVMSQIKNCITTIIKEECDEIILYIEKDKNGSYFEEYTGKVKILSCLLQQRNKNNGKNQTRNH